MPALALTILLHVALIAAALLVHERVVKKQEAQLIVMNLTPPPAPPPPASHDIPKQVSPPQVMAPRAIVPMLPSPVPIATTPDPIPVSQPIPVQAAAPPAPPAPPRVVDGGDIGAQMIAGKDPNYPTESLRKKEQGTVVVAVTVGLDGRVADIAVRRSSGFARLDKVVLDAVRKWRWRPIVRDGQAVMVRGFVEFPFVLQG